jgi:hypothetical protein
MPLGENPIEEIDPELSELPGDFLTKLGWFAYIKSTNNPTYSHDWSASVYQIIDLANGRTDKDLEEVRQTHYPGWETKHFRLLCQKLGFDYSKDMPN